MFKLALMGRGISHSLSPFIHKLGASMCQVPCTYEILDLDHGGLMSGYLNEMRQGRWDGFNITTPYKTEVIPHLDLAERSAVNTIFKKEGKLWGTSTDGHGFDQGLKSMGIDPNQFQEIFFLGCGGAVLSILEHWQLSRRPQPPLRVHILARSEASLGAQKLKAWALPYGMDLHWYGDFLDFQSHLYPEALLVQAVPKAALDSSTLDDSHLKHLPKNLIFYDLNYGLKDSHVFSGARSYFSNYTDGLPMLVEQARQSQKIWWDSPIEFKDLLRETETWLKHSSIKESL